MELISYFRNEILEIEKVKELTYKNIKDLNIRDNIGDTPLHYLCSNKSINLEILSFFVNLFIENNIHLLILNDFYMDPLNYLCRNQSINLEILSFFLDCLYKKEYDLNNIYEYLTDLDENSFCNIEMILEFAKYYEKEELINEIEEIYLKFQEDIDFFYDNIYILK